MEREQEAAVMGRLAELGYPVPETGRGSMIRAIARAARALCDATNQTTVPDGLWDVWVDLAAGMYLQARQACLEARAASEEAAPIKRITEGEVTVEFAGTSDGYATTEEQFQRLVAKLCHRDPSLIARYRRISW